MYVPEPQLGPVRMLMFRIVWPVIRWLTCLKQVDHSYATGESRASEDKIEQGCLEGAQIAWDVNPDAVARIPAEGPVLVISNHAYGMADGLIQAMLLNQVRPDYKQLVNEMLMVFPKLTERYICVNAFDSQQARQQNASPLRDAMDWLKDGHALATFPAGVVSHRTWTRSKPLDPDWNPSIIMLATRSKATVIPMFFHGDNGRLFQCAGLIWSRLRTMLIPRCYAGLRGRTIRVEIGEPISAGKLREFDDRAAAIEYLRSRVYMLESRRAQPQTTTPAQTMTTTTPPQPDNDHLLREIEALPEACLLGSSGDLNLYIAKAEEIPATLREIGRLREVTFRAVGEGTGNAVDLDSYDEIYRHLFIWNTKTREVIGSYRLGLTDEILAARGIEGFYTRTLFEYNQQMLDGLGDAIELGRSFIRPEYQRGFKPLMLLWRGISNFAAQHRRYRHCFGVVSISNDYSELSKALITRFLVQTETQPGYDSLVSSRTPWAPNLEPGADVDALLAGCNGIEDVDELVRDIEQSKVGVPVLVRQYLKLQAKLLAPFNVDRTFADCIDGLMLVDFMQVDRRIAHFYLGEEIATAFRTYHGFEPFAPASDDN
jgi:putative hemolysin